jgi:hypothetical protein
VISEILRRDHGVAEDEAIYLSRISEGCMEAALRFRQENVFVQRNRLMAGWLKGEMGLWDSQGRGASEMKESRQETEMGLYLLASWLRDILVAKIAADKKYFINADRFDDIIHFSRKLNHDELEGALKLVAQTTADIRANVNTRLALARLNSELQRII